MAIPKLIWLMQDMNWPGFPEAIEILRTIDIKILMPSIEIALLKGKEGEDYMWMGGLNNLIIDLGISKSDFINKDNFDILELADW